MFTAVVTSLVSDILLPPLSVILPLNKNLEEKFAVLRPGPERGPDGYNTLKQAQDDGAVVMAYGVFLNRLINFMGVGFSLYGLASLYQCFSKDPIIKHQVKCKYCRKWISEKVCCVKAGCGGSGRGSLLTGMQSSRCVNCTSWQDGREDRR